MNRLSTQLVLRALGPGLVVLVGHSIFGSAFGHEPIVDPISHFLGGCAVAYCALSLMPEMSGLFGRPSPFATMLLAICAGMMAALAWELGELASDIFLGTTIQIDARDTLRDLSYGFCGSVVVALRALVTKKYHPEKNN